MPRSTAISGWLALAAAISACNRSASGEAGADAREVRSYGLHGLADTASLSETSRVLVADAPAGSIPVTAFDIAADGRVVVASADGQIRTLTADGKRLATVRIPAQDSWIGALAIAPDQRIFALDTRHARIFTISADNSIISTVNIATAVHSRARSLFVTRANELFLLLDAAGGSPLLARVGDDGRLADTLQAAPEQIRACPPLPGEGFQSGHYTDIRVRYLATITATMLPTGQAVFGCNDDYSFNIVGDSKRIRVQRAWHKPPVSEDEKDSFMRAWTLRMRNAVKADPNWTWPGEALPDHKPSYHRVLAADDGTIWIWPTQPSARIAAPAQWVLIGGPQHLYIEPTHGVFDVYNAQGKLLRHVRLTGDLAFSAFSAAPDPVLRGADAWFLVTDSVQQFIARARVR